MAQLKVTELRNDTSFTMSHGKVGSEGRSAQILEDPQVAGVALKGRGM